MNYIQTFEHINKNDTAIAGGKGASLGEMIGAGIPVPPGFVILTSVFEKFLSANNLHADISQALSEWKADDVRSTEKTSARICGAIERAPIPDVMKNEITNAFTDLHVPYVAVRSSATAEDSTAASWAGQLTSYLNTNETALFDNIKKCWASLYSARALAYRFEQGLRNDVVSIAVVVQKMVNSDAAGIAFSVHPVSENRNEILAEAGFGLGEAVVSGEVTPDQYLISKNPERLLQITIADKKAAFVQTPEGAGTMEPIDGPKRFAQVLRNDQVLQLAGIVARIERHYGFPCDVEWALEGETFYIVQSRPITTLKPAYHFHYTVTDLGILHHDILLEPNGYGALDYRVMVERGVLHAYLTDSGITSAREAGKRLLDPDFFADLQRRADQLIIDMKAYDGPVVGAVAFREWDKIVGLFTELWALYLYCEQPVHAPLEEMIARKEGETDRMLAILETMGHIKLALHENAENVMKKGFDRIAQLLQRKRGITREEFYALRANEVSKLLKGERINRATVRKRLSGCVFVKEGGTWECVTGAVFKKQKEAIEQSLPKEVKGAGTYPGIARGTVVTHLSWTGVREIPPGAILVTGMTNSQMIPYIKNAAAIVTDEGGLMCHAAIISREWKIPCIVGTQTATQILSDGDFIEVDAHTGIVTILKKANG